MDECGTKPRKGIDATYLVAGLSAVKFWSSREGLVPWVEIQAG